MKVQELIELLKGQDPEMDVLVDGYEGGHTALKTGAVRVVEVVRLDDRTRDMYSGEYSRAWDGEPTVRMLLLSRHER